MHEDEEQHGYGVLGDGVGIIPQSFVDARNNLTLDPAGQDICRPACMNFS